MSSGRRACGAQMLFDEVRQRQHVVVDEDDALAARSRDAGVARVGQARRCSASRPSKRQVAPPPRALDHRRRVVGRAVVDQHDLVIAIRRRSGRSTRRARVRAARRGCRCRVESSRASRGLDQRRRGRQDARNVEVGDAGVVGAALLRVARMTRVRRAHRRPCAFRAAPSDRGSPIETERFRPSGSPTAAATCIEPVVMPTNALARRASAPNVPTLVAPAIETTPSPASLGDAASANGASAGDPRHEHRRGEPVAQRDARATSSRRAARRRAATRSRCTG